jgi:hypothetical protein
MMAFMPINPNMFSYDSFVVQKQFVVRTMAYFVSTANVHGAAPASNALVTMDTKVQRAKAVKTIARMSSA